MRRELLTALVGVGLAVSSAVAWAQAPGNVYLGAGIGQAKVKDACMGAAGITFTSCEDSHVSYKVFGGYQFHPNLAAELAYNNFASTTASFSGTGFSGDAKIDIAVYDLSLLGSWPLGSRFGILGRLGGYYGDLRNRRRITTGGTTTTSAVSQTNNGVTFGAGLSYQLKPQIGLRAEWQRFNSVGGEDTGRTDIDVLSVGALYRF